uniref:Ephrin-A1 n=1 Tax=Bubo bubo TaxID=30461 RepID=A0A8C0FQA7_BUBBB
VRVPAGPLPALCCWDRRGPCLLPSCCRFLRSNYTVEVRLNDYLDIICPHYEEGSVDPRAMERYTLYLVEPEEYRACKPRSKEQIRWECDKPSALHGPEKFSEKFQRFTPFTLGKEFKEGHSYYYISKPIHHHGEACLKLKVTVAGKGSEYRLDPPPVPPLSCSHSVGARLGLS